MKRGEYEDLTFTGEVRPWAGWKEGKHHDRWLQEIWAAWSRTRGQEKEGAL